MKIDRGRATTIAACLALAALSGCGKSKPVAMEAPPPAPVGHTYNVMVQVPAPVSPSIKFSATQHEQIQQAFNLIALKSALMVAALSCDQRDEYDAFMTRFQPHILAAQHVMDAYFHRASGPYSGQKMEDTFVTLLANNQSVSGIGVGSIFCLNNKAQFDAVMALKTPQELDRFVTDQAPPINATLASNASLEP